MGKLSKCRILSALPVLGALLLIAAAPSRAEPSQWSYVAVVVGTSGPLFDDPVGTPAGPVAPLGHFDVTPESSSFTVTFDDFGAVDGMAIPVHMVSDGAPVFSGCMPVRTDTTIAGVKPGTPVRVIVYNWGSSIYCSGLGTAGVATFDGVTPAET